MSLRDDYIKKMEARFTELKEKIRELREKADQAETNLELEYYTLVDELQVNLEIANQKLQLLRASSEENWEEFKSEFEAIWDSMHEMIRSITAP